jgi:hypothetical protein
VLDFLLNVELARACPPSGTCFASAVAVGDFGDRDRGDFILGDFDRGGDLALGVPERCSGFSNHELDSAFLFCTLNSTLAGRRISWGDRILRVSVGGPFPGFARNLSVSFVAAGVRFWCRGERGDPCRRPSGGCCRPSAGAVAWRTGLVNGLGDSSPKPPLPPTGAVGSRSSPRAYRAISASIGSKGGPSATGGRGLDARAGKLLLLPATRRYFQRCTALPCLSAVSLLFWLWPERQLNFRSSGK